MYICELRKKERACVRNIVCDAPSSRCLCWWTSRVFSFFSCLNNLMIKEDVWGFNFFSCWMITLKCVITILYEYYTRSITWKQQYLSVWTGSSPVNFLCCSSSPSLPTSQTSYSSFQQQVRTEKHGSERRLGIASNRSGGPILFYFILLSLKRKKKQSKVF